MRALVCGSLASDTIMVCDGYFYADTSRPLAYAQCGLTWSAAAPRSRGLRRQHRLQHAPARRRRGPVATVGSDAERYLDWMRQQDITTEGICVLDGEFTAQAFITTDLDDNQITAFHPRAMNLSHLDAVETGTGTDLGVLAPEGREGMIRHAEQSVASKIPFMFDPGQGLPMFDGEALRDFIGQADWVASMITTGTC